MQQLLIQSTKYTPAIVSSLDNYSISIEGKSYPENTFEFYEPVESYINDFLEFFKDQKITINFDIQYFNSSSSKIFFNIFDILEEAAENNQTIIVNWYYDEDNETIQEAGEDFAEDFKALTFNVTQKL